MNTLDESSGSYVARGARLMESADARQFIATKGTPKLDNPARYRRLIEILCEIKPTSPREIILWASDLQKQDRPDIAIDFLTMARRRFCNEAPLAIKLLQTYLAVRRVEEAGDLAAEIINHMQINERLGYFILLSFERSERYEDIVSFAENYRGLVSENADCLVIALKGLNAAGLFEEAAEIGDEALNKYGHGGRELHAIMGSIYDQLDKPTKAIEHFNLALAEAPDNVNDNAALGRLLLTIGQPRRAESCLSLAAADAPHLSHVKILHARALKGMGRYVEAADALDQLDPDLVAEDFTIRRQAVSYLNMAGRREEASDRFDQLLLEKEACLPETFMAGLDALDAQAAALPFSQSRLDWAWSFTDRARYPDRAEWERRAKWGYLADQLVLDWLECKTDEAEQAMQILADLSSADSTWRDVQKNGGRAVLASAHVGALYAGPLALELLNIPCRFMASTPSVASAPYRDMLISTSDQTEAAVAKASMDVMTRGEVLVIAVDGAMSMSTPRTPFEGRRVTYSSFASKLAHKFNAASFFVAPYWTPDRRLDCYFKPLPTPESDEPSGDFAERWRDEYFRHIRYFLSGAPENLRLSGGIWRHI